MHEKRRSSTFLGWLWPLYGTTVKVTPGVAFPEASVAFSTFFDQPDNSRSRECGRLVGLTFELARGIDSDNTFFRHV